MSRTAGTVFDDPEELNNYVKQQADESARASIEQIEREQQEARSNKSRDDD